jgi:hypothetical protein
MECAVNSDTSLLTLLHEIERLPQPEKWQLVKIVLQSLEQGQTTVSAQTDWLQFLHETYGSLRNTPIERWPQGDCDYREPLV